MKSRATLNVYARRARWLGVLLACVLAACSTTREGPSVSDTTTNWLHACKRNADCHGESSCIAGSCTIACSPKVESACSPLASEAECVQPTGAPAHCDLPCRFDRACDDLGDSYACDQGACRPKRESVVQESEREPELDASRPAPSPPPVINPEFDSGPFMAPNPPAPPGFDGGTPVDLVLWDSGPVDAGLVDSSFYFVQTSAEGGVWCPNEYPPVTWQPSTWEPFTSDAGRDERFRIVSETMVGRWRGLATPSWPKPFLVDLEFKADGHYSSRCSELMEPCCRVLNGTDEDNPFKQYRLLDALASGYVTGEIDLSDKNTQDGSFWSNEIPGKLSYIERDRSGNALRLNYRNADEGGLIRFDLRRVTTP